MKKPEDMIKNAPKSDLVDVNYRDPNRKNDRPAEIKRINKPVDKNGKTS